MSKYLIKLYPVDTFFFGNERTFGDDNSNYFVRSNMFPQQTSVLGMLRFELLKQTKDVLEQDEKGIRIKNAGTATTIIGESSFSTNNTKGYGCIKSISPVLIANNNDYYYLSTKEISDKDKKPVLFNFDSINKVKVSFGTKTTKEIPLLENYEAKHGFYEHFRMINGSKTHPVYYDKDKNEGVYVDNERVGILKKTKNVEDEDKGFFRQVSYSFNKGFCFAFFAEIDDFPILKNSIVMLGGETSTFRMVVEPQKEELYNQLFPENNDTVGKFKLILLNDAKVEKSVYNHCEFALTETIDFRFIETTVSSGNNYANKPKKSNAKFNLLKRGSVFYTQNISQLKTEIEKETAFRNIGYNFYKIEKQS